MSHLTEHSPIISLHRKNIWCRLLSEDWQLISSGNWLRGRTSTSPSSDNLDNRSNNSTKRSLNSRPLNKLHICWHFIYLLIIFISHFVYRIFFFGSQPWPTHLLLLFDVFSRFCCPLWWHWHLNYAEYAETCVTRVCF